MSAAQTSRRALLGGSAGLMTVIALPAAGGAAPHPDAELIEACNEYLRLQRAFEAHYAASGGDLEEGDPAYAMLAPVPDLERTIVSLRATTAEGYVARARCAAFHFLPNYPGSLDDPEEPDDVRFMAAGLRDLIHAERGADIDDMAGGRV